MYSSSSGHNIGIGINTNNLQTHMLNALEPVFVKNHVNLCLWGHVHKVRWLCCARLPLSLCARSSHPPHTLWTRSVPTGQYERSCGVNNFTCAEDDNLAPVHMVVGSAGNVYQVNWEDNLRKSPSTWDHHHVQPRWSVFRSADFGFSRIYTNATHLHAQFIGDQRGQVHDELWLETSPSM